MCNFRVKKKKLFKTTSSPCYKRLYLCRLINTKRGMSTLKACWYRNKFLSSTKNVSTHCQFLMRLVSPVGETLSPCNKKGEGKTADKQIQKTNSNYYGNHLSSLNRNKIFFTKYID